MNEKVLQIVIKAKNEAEQTLKGLNATLKTNEANFKKMAGAGAVGLGAITTAVGFSLKAYGESERAQRQLEHAMIGVSGGTKEQVDRVNELATALQKKAGVDGDALAVGVAQLSTFGLQSESVIGLTKSLADLTVNQSGLNAGAEDYESSANIMAKALNGQFGKLELMGIRFTDAQKKVIEFGTEQEKVGAIQEGFAQNLKETTDTVDGVDRSIAILKTSVGEVSESFGKLFKDALASVSTTLAPLMDSINEFVKNHPTLVISIVAITGVLSALLVVVGLLGVAIPAITVGLGVIGITSLAIAGTVGLVAVAIVALVAVIVWWVKNWEENIETIKWLWDGFVTFVSGLWSKFTEFINLKVIKPIVNFFVGMWVSIKESFKSGIDSLVDFFKPLIDTLEKVYKKITDIIEKAKEIAGGGVDKVKSLFTKGKATGGGVQVGQSYMVGEKGPEMFTPASNGSITPNYKMAGAGGVNLTINMNGGTYLDDRVAERIGDQIIQVFKRTARF